MDIRTQISPQPWPIKASFVLIALAIPATVFAQNKFFGTTTRGVEGGKGNAQIKMLMDENALRRNETTQNAGDIDGLETRMGTAEGAITTLEGTVSGHTSTLSDHATRIGTLETATADVEDHAKATMPGMCHETNAKLRWNTTTSVWECLLEGDPTVQPFAKTGLPTCTASQLLRSNGSGFTCVNAGSNYVITESDPKVGATTSDQWCRGTGSQVTCDQAAPTGNDARIGTLTNGKWCTSNGSTINCTSDAPSGSGAGSGAKVCSGMTPVGVGWQRYNSTDVFLDVDTTSCGFSTTPVYTAALAGTTNKWMVNGESAIYNATPTGFRIYLQETDYSGTRDLLTQESSGWSVNWIAMEPGTVGAGGGGGGGSAVSKYGSGNRCAGDDYIAVCGYAPGSAWNYNTCYGRGHATTYGWSLAWNATAKGYEYSGSVSGPVDVICSSGGGGGAAPSGPVSGSITGGCNFGSSWGTATNCALGAGVISCAAGNTGRAITYHAPSGHGQWNSAGTYPSGFCIKD